MRRHWLAHVRGLYSGVSFVPRLDILPAPQQAVWRELGSVPPHFTLYGGTAVALHLGHRQSVDFDFFAAQPIDPVALARELPLLAGGRIAQSEPNTLTVIVERNGDPVKLSFFGLPWLRRVHPAHIADTGVKVAALLDVAATKMATVQARAEAKDYADIAAMLRRSLPLADMLAAARAVNGDSFAALPTLKALSYYGDGNLPTVTEADRATLIAAVRSVRADALPEILPLDESGA